MSGDTQRAPIRRVAWRIIAIVLLAGLSMRAALAQQPVADAAAVTRPFGSRGPADAVRSQRIIRPSAALPGNAGPGIALPQPMPAPHPLVVSRGTIDGTAFTRPGTRLMPLGGAAKPAATGINGTSIRPKH